MNEKREQDEKMEAELKERKEEAARLKKELEQMKKSKEALENLGIEKDTEMSDLRKELSSTNKQRDIAQEQVSNASKRIR